MEKVKVKIVRFKGNVELPKYATVHSAGMDLKACMDAPIELAPMQRTIVPTGIKIQLPEGYEAQIRPRSGLSAKKGIVAVLGTIDADYRGEVGIILMNLSTETFTINPGERLAQMVVKKYEKAEWEEVDNLDESERGEGGFGSTGTK